VVSPAKTKEEETVPEHDVLLLEWLEYAHRLPVTPDREALVTRSITYLANQYPDLAFDSQQIREEVQKLKDVASKLH
jgi:hypothetical protein